MSAESLELMIEDAWDALLDLPAPPEKGPVPERCKRAVYMSHIASTGKLRIVGVTQRAGETSGRELVGVYTREAELHQFRQDVFATVEEMGVRLGQRRAA